jgi:CheY-like chemotaxis protein
MHTSSSSCLPHKVLYVEDQVVNALLMRALFERIPDCELVLADNGRRALEVARGLHPALLLLDLRLPDLHGSELLPLLRRVPGCEHAPAMAVTAEHEYDITGTGFDEMWRKPLNLLKVIERVQCLLAPPHAQTATTSPHLELRPLTTPALLARLAVQGLVSTASGTR